MTSPSLLWRNVPTMHNWYHSRVSPEAPVQHREHSVGGHQTSHRACPVPSVSVRAVHLSSPHLDPSWSHPGPANYLVDKTSSELRPGRPQTVRPVITEKHSSLLTSSPCISIHQLFVAFQLFKNNFHQITKIFYSDRARPTSCQCSETLNFPGP